MDRTTGTETGFLKLIKADKAEVIACPPSGQLLLQLWPRSAARHSRRTVGPGEGAYGN